MVVLNDEKILFLIRYRGIKGVKTELDPLECANTFNIYAESKN